MAVVVILRLRCRCGRTLADVTRGRSSVVPFEIRARYAYHSSWGAVGKRTHTLRCSPGRDDNRGRRKVRGCSGDWRFSTARLSALWDRSPQDQRIVVAVLGDDL